MSNLMLYNVKMPPKAVARLRSYCVRIGVSQGMLLQRFIFELPGRKDVARKVNVDITAPTGARAKGNMKAARRAKSAAPAPAAKRKYTRKPKSEPVFSDLAVEMSGVTDLTRGTINDAPAPTEYAPYVPADALAETTIEPAAPALSDDDQALLADMGQPAPAPEEQLEDLLIDGDEPNDAEIEEQLEDLLIDGDEPNDAEIEDTDDTLQRASTPLAAP